MAEPRDYGPFDHVHGPGHREGCRQEQADMLSLDEDGDVEDHCAKASADIDGDCGHTHYQFKAVDDNGRIRSQ